MITVELGEQTRLLLKRADSLRRELHQEATLPRPDVLAALVVSFADVLKREMDSQENLRAVNRELEGQLGHLRRKAEEGQAAARRYRDLFEYALDACLVTDPSGVIEEANAAAAVMLNTPRRKLAGKALSEFIDSTDRAIFATLLLHARQLSDLELCVQPRGMAAVHTMVNLSTIYDEKDQPLRLQWTLSDVTEQRQAYLALNASERRFRAVFDEASLGIVLFDGQGCIARANRAFQSMLGRASSNMTGLHMSEVTHPDDWDIAQASLDAIKSGEKKQVLYEKRFLHSDGSVVWTKMTVTQLQEEPNQPPFYLGLAENITGERQAEAELAEMRRRLLESGEADRQRLAQELHDGPVQDLYGAVFHVANDLEGAADPRMRENLKDLQDMLKRVAGTLLDVCGELRPPTLGNLGLEPAIRSHAERIQEQYPGIRVQLHLTRDGKLLPHHTRLALFRIYQECMANILRHAQATEIMVAFHATKEEAALAVWDNGQGFELPEKWVDLLRDGHSGLAGVAERVQALGGELKIETRPGGGTLVHVTAPVEG